MSGGEGLPWCRGSRCGSRRSRTCRRRGCLDPSPPPLESSLLQARTAEPHATGEKRGGGGARSEEGAMRKGEERGRGEEAGRDDEGWARRREGGGGSEGRAGGEQGVRSMEKGRGVPSSAWRHVLCEVLPSQGGVQQVRSAERATAFSPCEPKGRAAVKLGVVGRKRVGKGRVG